MNTIKKNDKAAYIFIGIVSAVVFIAVTALSKIKLEFDPGFDVHIFAKINAGINSVVSVLLILGLVAIKSKKQELHRLLMMSSMALSVLFLVSYIFHHLLTDPTSFIGEGIIKTIYYFVLITHVFLAAIILPFILFTAYRALTGEYPVHKKLAKYTWPVWLYVSVTGVVVYLMISPYYPA
jgi:putative membrane protein